MEFDQGILGYKPKFNCDKYEKSSMQEQFSGAEADLRQHPRPPSKVSLSVTGVIVYLLSFCVTDFSLIFVV